jgi:hypothetical protein
MLPGGDGGLRKSPKRPQRGPRAAPEEPRKWVQNGPRRAFGVLKEKRKYRRRKKEAPGKPRGRGDEC